MTLLVNKTETTQHVLKMQLICLLPKYIKLILGMVSLMCIHTEGLLTHWHTQPAVRRSEPSMSFTFNSSLLSVDGMTCLLPFES